MKLLLIFILIFSCSPKNKHKEQETLPVEKTTLERLKEKHKLYLELQPSALDEDGWPTTTSPCDAVGFLALCKTAQGCGKANYFDAEESPGKWQRNQHKNCVETGKSKTSISKDMLMMGFVYGLFGMDKQTAVGYFNRLEEYGKANDWIMGYPSETIDHLARVYMTPTMTMTLYNIIQKLSGSSVEEKEVKGVSVPRGYQAHLRVLDVLIQAKINGGIDEIHLNDMTTLHERDPRNALYQAVFHRYRDGDMTEVADILLDDKLFPSDRLPSSADRCEPYLWQRDQGKDWEGCDEGHVHNGIDFLFAYWVAGFK
jgi:hypothetical protein